MKLYCFNDGQLEIGEEATKEAILIAYGEQASLEKVVAKTGKLMAKNGKEAYFIPGLPFADDPHSYADMLREWLKYAKGIFVRNRCTMYIVDAF